MFDEACRDVYKGLRAMIAAEACAAPTDNLNKNWPK
jgi:hypothetical protein